MEVWGIVVAAGMGRRFGRLKQHVELGGVPIWQRARDSLRAGGADQVWRGEYPAASDGVTP